MKKLLLSAVIASVLTGCGGGGSAEQPWFDESDGEGGPPETPVVENAPPSITGLPSSPLSVAMRESIVIEFQVADPEGDPVQLSLSHPVPGVNLFDDRLEVIPGGVGSVTFHVIMDDGHNVVASDNVTLNYTPPDTVLIPISSDFSMADGMLGQVLIYNDQVILDTIDVVFDSTTPMLSLPYPMPENYRNAHVSFRLRDPEDVASYLPSVAYGTLSDRWDGLIDDRFVLVDNAALQWQTNALDTAWMMTLSERRFSASPFGIGQVDSLYQQRELAPHIAPSSVVDYATLYSLSRNDGMLLWLNDYLSPAFAGMPGDEFDVEPNLNMEGYDEVMAAGVLRSASTLMSLTADIHRHVSEGLAPITMSYFLDAYAETRDDILSEAKMPALSSGRYMMLQPVDADLASEVGELFEFDVSGQTIEWLSASLPGIDASADPILSEDKWVFPMPDGVATAFDIVERNSIGVIVDSLVEKGISRVDANRMASVMIDDDNAILRTTGKRWVALQPVITTQSGHTGLLLLQQAEVVLEPGDESDTSLVVSQTIDSDERWLSKVTTPDNFVLNSTQDNVVIGEHEGAGWYSFYYEPQVESWHFNDAEPGWRYIENASVTLKPSGWRIETSEYAFDYTVVASALPMADAVLSRESGVYSAWVEYESDQESKWSLSPLILQEKDLCQTFPEPSSPSPCDPSPFFNPTKSEYWRIVSPGVSLGDATVGWRSGFAYVDEETGITIVDFEPVLKGNCDVVEGETTTRCFEPDISRTSAQLQYNQKTGRVVWQGESYWAVRLAPGIMHFYQENGRFLRFQKLLDNH